MVTSMPTDCGGALVVPDKARVRGSRYENLFAVSSKYPRIVRTTCLRVLGFGFRVSDFVFRVSCWCVSYFVFQVSVLGFGGLP